MTQAVPFGGKDLRVYRLANGAADANPKFLCTVTTKALQKTNEFDDATVPDCDNQDAVAQRRSIKKMTAWSINISGMADAISYRALDQDCDSSVPIFYRYSIAKAKADGGGYWQGWCWYENLQMNSESMGVVKFSGQIRGEGPLTWVAAAQ